MIWITGHPGFRRLSRFADGELRAREQARVASHLADCPRCREDVALVRRMARAARTMPTPRASDELLQQALARRAASERVLLPTTDAGAPATARPRTARTAAIAAMLTLLVGSLVVSVRMLEADRPDLRLHPEGPVAGEVLSVEYHGGALFADQTHLKLRARYRTATDRQWQLLAGILVRGDDGLYRTDVALPDSVVYAAFAVEDLYGERLDSNNRQLWDIMVRGDDGTPTLDAMAARLRDLERRDWGEAYDVAREMTERYPDEPRSWATRFSYELGLFDRDSVFDTHRAEFRRLEKRLSEDPRPEPQAMGWLASYALGLGDIASASTWVDRAGEQGRHLSIVAESEMMLLALRHEGDLELILSELEDLWTAVEGGSVAIANLGWQTAKDLGEPATMHRWLDRYLVHRPREDVLLLADAADATPEMVSFTTVWTAERLPYLQRRNDGLRPLHVSQDDHLRRETAEIQGFLAKVGSIALENGDTETAESLAMKAKDLGWNSRGLLELSAIFLAVGDTAEATRLLARAAADPLWTSAAEERGDDLSNANATHWQKMLTSARNDLRSDVLDAAVLRYLPGGVDLRSESRPVQLTDVIRERVTVLVFLSRYSAPAIDQLESLAELSQSLDGMGADLVLLDIDDMGPLARSLVESSPTIRVFSDFSGSARSALGSSKTPDIFVVDESGRIRFEHSEIGEVLRQVEALQHLRGTGVQIAHAYRP